MAKKSFKYMRTSINWKTSFECGDNISLITMLRHICQRGGGLIIRWRDILVSIVLSTINFLLVLENKQKRYTKRDKRTIEI